MNLIKTDQSDWDITIALRYLPVVSILNRLADTNDKILEVGSGSLGICPYLDFPRQVTGADISFSQNVHPLLSPIKASALKLPFLDNSYDFIISIDTLEHIPKDERKKAVKEMVRITKKGIVLGFPCGYFAGMADRLLNWYYFKTHKEKSSFLAEHLRNRLPEVSLVNRWFGEESKFKNKKIKIENFNNTNIFLWISLLLMGFSQNKYLCRLYKYSLTLIPILRYLNFPPAYRKMVFVNFTENEK